MTAEGGHTQLEDGESDVAGRSTARSLLGRQTTVLSIVLIVMTAVFTVSNPLYLSTNSIANILQDWAPVMLLAVGQTFIILTSGIDLSVGANLGLTGVCAALAIRYMEGEGYASSLTIAVGVSVAIGVGAIVGLTNGLLITRVNLAPFIATLATMGIATGLTLVTTKGVQVAGGPRAVIKIGTTRYFDFLTTPLIVVIIIVAISWAVLALCRFGRWTYAIGSNEFASRAAGIDVDRHLIKLYVLSGCMAGVAGLFVYFRLGSGSPTSGRGSELTAIAAVVIGGTSLFGGSGRMSGTILGALITSAVLSGLILIGVPPNLQQVVVGVLIAAAVGVQQFSASARSGS